MANRPKRSGLCLLAELAVLLHCEIHPASAREIDILASLERLISPKQDADKRDANANALVSRDASTESKAAPQSTRKQGSGSAKGPYYVDFRARTAASWGHAFVWFGKTSERAVEVAGLPLRETPCLMSWSSDLGAVRDQGELWRS